MSALLVWISGAIIFTVLSVVFLLFSRSRDIKIRHIQLIAASTILGIIVLSAIGFGALYFTGYFDTLEKIAGGFTAIAIIGVGILHEKSPGSNIITYLKLAYQHRHLRIDHWVKVHIDGSYTLCKVKNFGLSGVKCVTWDASIITFGLGQFYDAIIENMTAQEVFRRRTIILVSRDQSIEEVDKMIREKLKQSEMTTLIENDSYKSRVETFDSSTPDIDVPDGYRAYAVYTYHNRENFGWETSWDEVRKLKGSIDFAVDALKGGKPVTYYGHNPKDA